MNELPSGWVVTEIGAIARIETGNTPPKSNSAYYGREVCFFKPGDLDVGGVVTHSEDMVSRSGADVGRLLPTNTLLVTCIGNLGKSALIGAPSICNQQINAVLPTSAAEPQYLYYWSRTIRAWLEENSSATTVSIINKGRFSKAPIGIAPLPEQRRIVAKIDSLSAKSRLARERLDHIPRLVEKYKQSILAAAFGGDLTREWRAKNARNRIVDHHSNQIDARLSELPDLPSSWRWQAISEVMGISGGLTKNPKRSAMAMQRPYLRVANVYANELRLAEISETGCTEKEFEKTKLAPGDLLIVEGNGSLEQIGRVAIWNDEIRECSHQNHIIRARPSEIVEPRYALFWMLSPAGRKAIEAVASSSSGLHTLSITKVGGLPIPLCAKLEQVEIVQLIDNAFVWIDRLASETSSARKLIDHLDQAILAKAFRGELVPQDPNDEPATMLLERISEERKGAPSAKNPTTKKKK
jgi:type I restriction enzyme, S subunit